MKIISLIVTFLTLSLYSSVFAEEKKCRSFDLFCKTTSAVHKIVDDTKKFQKKEWNEAEKKMKKKLEK